MYLPVVHVMTSDIDTVCSRSPGSQHERSDFKSSPRSRCNSTTLQPDCILDKGAGAMSHGYSGYSFLGVCSVGDPPILYFDSASLICALYLTSSLSLVIEIWDTTRSCCRKEARCPGSDGQPLPLPTSILLCSWPPGFLSSSQANSPGGVKVVHVVLK